MNFSIFQVAGTMTEYSKQESYKFPDSNSFTSTDEKYFEMIQNETDLRGKQENFTFSNSQVREDDVIRIDQHGAPDSNSLTEADREYFNIIKTEDGFSDFFKTKTFLQEIFHSKIFDRKVNKIAQRVHKDAISSQNNNLNNNPVYTSDNQLMFKYHLVSLDYTNKNKKPIVGLYLPNIN